MEEYRGQLTDRLRQLDTKASATYLTIAGQRFSIAKLRMTHPFHNPQFCQLAFTPEITALCQHLNWQDAVQATADVVANIQLAHLNRPPEMSAENAILTRTHKLCMDIHSGDYFLWSEKDQRISEWSVKAFSSKLPKEVFSDLRNKAPLSKITFDPFRGVEKQWWEPSEGLQVLVHNSYRPPQWMTQNFTQEDKKRPEVYPPLFLYLLQCLIPDPAHLSVVLDWLALAVFDRPEAFLTLRGARGNGKNKLMYILFHLVGNFYVAQKKILTEFNADIKNKRIIGIDDNPIIGTEQGHMLRKSISNPIMSYNEKHLQTSQSEKMHASFIIVSNPSDKFYVRWDERKIVAPTITDQKMETWVTPEIFEWIRPFEDTSSNDPLPEGHVQFLREIGYGLFSRFCQHKPKVNTMLKEGYFWFDVYSSLTSFKRYILRKCLYWDSDMVESGGTIEYDIVREDYLMNEKSGGHIDNWHTLRDWVLADFLWRDEKIVLSVNESAKTMVANPAIRKE